MAESGKAQTILVVNIFLRFAILHNVDYEKTATEGESRTICPCLKLHIYKDNTKQRVL